MKGESGASDDELNSDVVSHYSSASESTSVVEEGTGLSANSHTRGAQMSAVLQLFVGVLSNRGGAGG